MESKTDRTLEIFFRAIKGERISVRTLADKYGVSTKSISRSINELKNFFAERRELVGNTELEYDYSEKVYRLNMDEFLSSKELFSIVEVLLGTRAFSKLDALTITEKLKRFTTPADRKLLNEHIQKEMFHYNEVKHDCDSVLDNLWRLSQTIHEHKKITVRYFKMNRACVEHKLCPLSLMFTEYYFYLIAFKDEDSERQPLFFRVDRITDITVHRERFVLNNTDEFDEGLLRERCQFMFPGKLRKIRFEFSGPSVQAILDRLPTAKIIEKRTDNKYLIEAEVYGDGIRMFLLSQGSWVKVVAPQEFVEEMQSEISAMKMLYLQSKLF